MLRRSADDADGDVVATCTALGSSLPTDPLVTRPLLRPAVAALRLLGRLPERVGDDLVLLFTDTDEQTRQANLWQWLGARHVGQLLDHLAIDCVLDVGANDGDFAGLVRAGGWNGRIVSFEPQSSCRAALDQLASGDPGWSIHSVALSDHDGTATLTLRAASQLTSLNQPRLDSRTAKSSRVKDFLSAVGTEEIIVRRLDSIFGELEGGPIQRAYLKIDTQGHDELVLAGAAGILDRVGAIQLELTQEPLYHSTSHYLAIAERLEALGFGLNAVFPVLFDADSRALLEFDGLFVRVDRSRTGSPNDPT